MRRSFQSLPMVLAGLCAAAVAHAQADTPTSPGTPSDGEIASAVEDELLFDPSVSGMNVETEVDQGIVQLSGTVEHLLAKHRAVEIAKTVRGVRGVVDELHLMPSQATDERLEEDVKQALLEDPATDLYELEVAVEGGTVTLRGAVDSYQEVKLAGRVAMGVRGIRELENLIGFSYTSKRADTELQAEVEKILEWDALVDAGLIDVTVRDQVVTLKGTVGSAAERDRAIDAAWITGVDRVEAGLLIVEPWARDTHKRETATPQVGDAQITHAVEDALFYDPRANSFEIAAVTSNGTVTLRGTVDNLKAKRAAGATARNVVGVKYVLNLIEVDTPLPTDETLEARIMSALIRDPYCELYEIRVDVKRGTARLTGEVDSWFERAQADDVASRVKGVLDVDNDLRVARDAPLLILEPHVDYDWYAYDYSWHRTSALMRSIREDAELRDSIKSQLFWSPFVDADEVEVTVLNGVATLSGTVDSWAEFTAARENAFEGGAIAVKNRLKVDLE